MLLCKKLTDRRRAFQQPLFRVTIRLYTAREVSLICVGASIYILWNATKFFAINSRKQKLGRYFVLYTSVDLFSMLLCWLDMLVIFHITF